MQSPRRSSVRGHAESRGMKYGIRRICWVVVFHSRIEICGRRFATILTRDQSRRVRTLFSGCTRSLHDGDERVSTFIIGKGDWETVCFCRCLMRTRRSGSPHPSRHAGPPLLSCVPLIWNFGVVHAMPRGTYPNEFRARSRASGWAVRSGISRNVLK